MGCMALITDTRLQITSELDKNVNESVLRSSFFNRSKTCTQQIYLIYLNLITDGDKTANFVSALASYIFEVKRPLTMPAIYNVQTWNLPSIGSTSFFKFTKATKDSKSLSQVTKTYLRHKPTSITCIHCSQNKKIETRHLRRYLSVQNDQQIPTFRTHRTAVNFCSDTLNSWIDMQCTQK